MNPQGELSTDCITFSSVKIGSFCDTSPELRRKIAFISSIGIHPRGHALTIEGQPAKGIFVVCAGQVKLSSTSREGKTVITSLVETGDVLGLSAVISGDVHQTTAITLEPCITRFISRPDFIRFLRYNAELGVKVAQALSKDLCTAYREIRALSLAAPMASKFASLLISWLPNSNSNNTDGEAKIIVGYTHEQIAEMIGASRETVTRIISYLKREQIIDVRGSTLVVRNRSALELLVV